MPCLGEVQPEDPGPLPVESLLSPAEISGPDWTVRPTATTDGITVTYVVDSRFGSWPAVTRIGLAQRLREIHALAELEEISRSEVFLDAVKNSVTSQLELVQDFAERPGETLRAIPSSAGRWFRKTKFRVRESYHDAKAEVRDFREQRREERAAAQAVEDPETEVEGADRRRGLSEETKQEIRELVYDEALDYLRISRAERAWYARLQVDPSTDNEVLRRAVTKVARVEGLTSFGMKFVGVPSIPGASELSDVMDLVWESDPWELRRIQFESMVAAGLSKTTARAFQDSRHLSLTIQTAFLETLSRLDGVAGRESIIARAIEAGSKPDAEALLGSTALLAHLNATTHPLEEILPTTHLPVARARSGALVSAVAREALFWTTPVRDAAVDFAETYADTGATERLLYTSGTASETFRRGIEDLGWTVRDGLRARITETSEAN